MLVLFHHFMMAFYPSAYFFGDPKSSHLGSLELIYFRSPLSVITNGRFMVALFFVLSGYVLSRSYIKTNQISILVSSALRRYLRLYIPVAFTLIIGYIVLRSCNLNVETSQITNSSWLKSLATPDTSFKTFLKCFVYKTMIIGDSRYDTTMWTMNLELFGSFLVFSLLALTHKIRAKWVIFILLSIFIFIVFNHYYIAFIIGISLNYLDNINLDKVRQKKIVAPVLFIIGLILGGYPSLYGSYSNETFYRFLGPPTILNDPKMIHILGATFIMVALILSKTLQKIFSGKPFIFLGEISFTLYLIHPLIISTFSCFLFLNFYKAHPDYNLVALVTFLATILVTLIISKIMTLYIDKPGLRFSKYIYTRFFKGIE